MQNNCFIFYRNRGSACSGLSKLIPEILNFIAIKELSFTIKSIKSEYKAKKYFIWGFEEPENSYEYRNAQILADKFKDVYSKNAQIFISTHSFNFLSLRGENISVYRIWKDHLTNSSKISKLKFDNQGKIKFDSTALSSDWELLQEELGFFYLNQELNQLYNEKRKQLEFIKSQTEEIDKPIIYSEGNNYKYLVRAKEIFCPNVEVEIKNCGGKNELQKLFKLFVKTDFNRFNVLFVFDCDATGPYDDCRELKTKTLTPYIFSKNENNKIKEIQSGIENAFDEDIISAKDESFLFSITTVNKDGVIISRDRKIRKDNFEKYILEERNEDSDFYNFEQLFTLLKGKTEGRQN